MIRRTSSFVTFFSRSYHVLMFSHIVLFTPFVSVKICPGLIGNMIEKIVASNSAIILQYCMWRRAYTFIPETSGIVCPSFPSIDNVRFRITISSWKRTLGFTIPGQISSQTSCFYSKKSWCKSCIKTPLFRRITSMF